MAFHVPIDSNRPNWNPSDSDEWEVCNDNGFVYKRRRRSSSLQPPSSSSVDCDAAFLHRSRRHRKKKSLLSLKEKYSQELNYWKTKKKKKKSLLSAVAVAVAVAANVGPTSSTASPPPPIQRKQLPMINELLLQAEAQEAVLGKLSELCDYVEFVCDAEEERFAKELADLPIWGSPKALVSCLQSL